MVVIACIILEALEILLDQKLIKVACPWHCSFHNRFWKQLDPYMCVISDLIFLNVGGCPQGPKRVSDPLELELQAAVSFLTLVLNSSRLASVLTTVPSLQLLILPFN